MRSTSVAVNFVNGTSSFTLTSTDGGLVQTILLPNTVTITSADGIYIFAPSAPWMRSALSPSLPRVMPRKPATSSSPIYWEKSPAKRP
ncbi:hypothetical protein JYT26_00725 [Beggiatoa alba]|nr:hypothetical protein [Beggiatoa alba]